MPQARAQLALRFAHTLGPAPAQGGQHKHNRFDCGGGTFARLTGGLGVVRPKSFRINGLSKPNFLTGAYTHMRAGARARVMRPANAVRWLGFYLISQICIHIHRLNRLTENLTAPNLRLGRNWIAILGAISRAGSIPGGYRA
jgi:hypothetical protein